MDSLILPDYLLHIDNFEKFANRASEIEDTHTFIHPTELFEDIECLADPMLEFDCPKYFDFETWSLKLDVLGLDAYKESEIEMKKRDRWFKQHHIDHEHEIASKSVNLLNQLDEPQLEENESSLINKTGHDKNGGMKFRFGYELDEVEQAEDKVHFPKSTTLKSSRKILGDKKLDFTALLRRNVTSREDRDNIKFIKEQDATSLKRTRVVPLVCHAPTTLATNRSKQSFKKANTTADELKELLKEQHVVSKAIRMQKVQKKQEKSNIQVKEKKVKIPQTAERLKEEDELMLLLKQHNRNLKKKP